MMTDSTSPDFAAMLQSAVTEPGKIAACYSVFHGYSLGNQMLAAAQCEARGIPLGPIATFPTWKERGRFVQKGQKALELCMPVTCKRKGEATEDGTTDDATFTRFIYKRNWFALAQTEGDAYTPTQAPAWDKASALAALDVTETDFTLMDGNCQGFARGRAVAVSPIAAHPFKTLFHELAHVLLGHTAEVELSDDERTPKSIREVEAEATAMLCCAALGLPGLEYSRGYIQHWYQSSEPIPEASARRIFKAADSILKAGQTSVEGGR